MKVTNIEVSAFRDVKISPYQKGMIGVKASVSLDENDSAIETYKLIQDGLWTEADQFAAKIENDTTK